VSSRTAKIPARDVRPGEVTVKWGRVDRTEKVGARYVRIYFVTRSEGRESAGFAVEFPASARIEVEE
jgi:hypothetical protein